MNKTIKLKENPTALEQADIGWRWCKDELPEDNLVVTVVLFSYHRTQGYYTGAKWYTMENQPFKAEVNQWLKAPEPLVEEPMTYDKDDDFWGCWTESKHDFKARDNFITEEERYQQFKARLEDEG